MMGAVPNTSPDSWCKRFNVDNASLKSDRFLNGPMFPDLLREIHQFCLCRKGDAHCMCGRRETRAQL